MEITTTTTDYFCNSIQSKKAIQRHPTRIKDADYDYILDEIERREKLSLNGMLVLIVTRDSTDGNNHNAILYMAVHCRIIIYIYVNAILLFILVCFYFCV